jgi:hypothetical protein
MATSFIDYLAEELVKLGVAQPQEFIGCTQEQVEEIKIRQHVSSLPSLYEEFLLKMGRSAGKFLPGPEHFYPIVLELKEVAVGILKENLPSFVLPDDAFIFTENQGYEFMFFLTNEKSDDPPVFHYLEGDGKLRKEIAPQQWEHLSDFYKAMLEWWQKQPRR